MARIDKPSVAFLMAQYGATIWVPYFHHRIHNGIYPGITDRITTDYHVPDHNPTIHHYDGWYLANPDQFHPDPDRRRESKNKLEWWCVRCTMDRYPEDEDMIDTPEMRKQLHENIGAESQNYRVWLEWVNEESLDGNNLVQPKLRYVITSVKRGVPPFMRDPDCPMYVRFGTWGHRWRAKYSQDIFVDADGRQYILPRPGGGLPSNPPGVVKDPKFLKPGRGKSVRRTKSKTSKARK